MHRTWGKPDANQAAIVAALRKAGVSVQSLSAVGSGCPDLLCSYHGYVTLLEVKQPGKNVTPAQRRWHAAWDAYCPLFVVETPDDAVLVARERLEGAGRYRV